MSCIAIFFCKKQVWEIYPSHIYDGMPNYVHLLFDIKVFSESTYIVWMYKFQKFPQDVEEISSDEEGGPTHAPKDGWDSNFEPDDLIKALESLCLTLGLYLEHDIKASMLHELHFFKSKHMF